MLAFFPVKRSNFDQNADINNTAIFADVSIISMFLFVQYPSLFLITSSDFSHNKKIEKTGRFVYLAKKIQTLTIFTQHYGHQRNFNKYKKGPKAAFPCFLTTEQLDQILLRTPY